MTDTTIAHRERLALCDLFDEVGPGAPTLCEGWATRDLAAHIILRETRPDLAAGMFVPFLQGRLESAQDALAATAFPALVEKVRTGPPFWNPMGIPVIDELMNLVEFVVHHEDVLRGDVMTGGQPGPRREVDPAIDKAVWGALKRMAPMMFRRSEIPVSLTVPGRGTIEAKAGPDPVLISGTPIELLLTAYGRGRAAAVSYDGPPNAIETLKKTKLGLA